MVRALNILFLADILCAGDSFMMDWSIIDWILIIYMVIFIFSLPVWLIDGVFKNKKIIAINFSILLFILLAKVIKTLYR